MGIMTAPVVGSGSWPAWMHRVAKSSRFDLVIQASRTAVIMRASEGSGKTRHCAAPETITRLLGEYRMLVRTLAAQKFTPQS
jgi:hypothetical protein